MPDAPQERPLLRHRQRSSQSDIGASGASHVRLPHICGLGHVTGGFLAAFALLFWAQCCEADIRRFVEGIDAMEKPMRDAEVSAQLNDPWAVLVLRKGVFPNDLTTALDAVAPVATGDGYPDQQSFFVSESGQLPLDAAVMREFRMVVLRSKPTESVPSILFSAPAGERAGFIELMSWDATKKAFNFYRRPKAGQWTWKGDTGMAFDLATAGKGCFQCHTHGAPVVKELRRPWNNWHSQAASIPAEAIPSDEIKHSPLFTAKSGAEQLEGIVRALISTTTKAFVDATVTGRQTPDARLLLRPLFGTETANLQSSQQRSVGLSAQVDLPPGFFLNFDALSHVLGIETLGTFSGMVDRASYEAAVNKFSFRLEDGDGFSQPGDTHFGFLVPVAAESGTALIRELIAQRLITPHFALSVLLVDFSNPVYSAARGSLLQYVPVTATLQPNKTDLMDAFVQAVRMAAAGTKSGSPEHQFLAHWDQASDGLKAEAAQRVQAYQTAVLRQLKMPEGVSDYTRLAESRRRHFAENSLNEFPLLLPVTTVPADQDLRMLPDGTVSP